MWAPLFVEVEQLLSLALAGLLVRAEEAGDDQVAVELPGDLHRLRRQCVQPGPCEVGSLRASRGNHIDRDQDADHDCPNQHTEGAEASAPGPPELQDSSRV